MAGVHHRPKRDNTSRDCDLPRPIIHCRAAHTVFSVLLVPTFPTTQTRFLASSSDLHITLHREHMAFRHPSSAVQLERASLLFVSPAALILQSSRPSTLRPLSFHHCSTMYSHRRRKPSLSMSNPSHPFTAGDEIQGIVTRITNYGAFLQLPGGLSGLVHISEIADRFVKSVSDHVNVGDTITVRVLSIDRERRKITLSRRQAMRSTGYDRVVELGGDWGHPWNDEGNTNYMQLSTTTPHTHPCHWEPDPSLFKPFDPPPSNESNLGVETQLQSEESSAKLPDDYDDIKPSIDLANEAEEEKPKATRKRKSTKGSVDSPEWEPN